MVEHYNDGTGSPEMKQWRRKNRAKGRGQTATVQAIKEAKKLEEAALWPSPCQRDAKTATTAPGTPKKETPAM